MQRFTSEIYAPEYVYRAWPGPAQGCGKESHQPWDLQIFNFLDPQIFISI